jgi:hypothetical protein
MPDRQDVLETVARAVSRSSIARVTRVAIDGVDGAGKTHFADELGLVLGASGASVIRASVDGFHNPRSIRYRQGRDSPEGFFRDSYDYAQLKAVLLDPLSPGHYRAAVFDHRSDLPVSAPSNQRYVRGQELYLRTCEPARFATFTINNDDLLAPYIVTPSTASPRAQCSGGGSTP